MTFIGRRRKGAATQLADMGVASHPGPFASRGPAGLVTHGSLRLEAVVHRIPDHGHDVEQHPSPGFVRMGDAPQQHLQRLQPHLVDRDAHRGQRRGAHLRAVGENPEAARAAGLPVVRLQYTALALSGALAGVGGLYLSMGYLSLFQADMTGGRGFLALAAVFLGARRPLGTLAAALLFGAASVAAAQLGLLEVPTQLVHLLPPLVTLLTLVAVAEWRQRQQRRRQRQTAPPG